MRKMISLSVMLLWVFMSFVAISGCSKKGASIEGHLKDAYTNLPIAYPDVTIETKTNIKEELNRAKITTSPDKNGEFIIKGLLPEQVYIIFSEDKYVKLYNQSITTPLINETYVISEPLYVIETTRNALEYVYNKDTSHIFEFQTEYNEFRLYEQLSSVFNAQNIVLYKQNNKYLLLVRIAIDDKISDNLKALIDNAPENFKILSSQSVLSSVINKPFKKINLQKFQYNRNIENSIYPIAAQHLLINGLDKINLSFVRGSSLFLISSNKAIGNIKNKLMREKARLVEDSHYHLVIVE